MSFYKLSSLVLYCLVRGVKIFFLWQLRERGKVRARDLISISLQSIFSDPLLPHAKIDHLITHPLYLPLWLCPLFSPRFFSYHFYTPLPPSTPSYPLHHLALRLSLSLRLQAGGITCQLTLTQQRNSFRSLAPGLIGVR